MITRIILLLVALLTLNGCASLNPRLFNSEEEILSSRGTPTRIWDNPDGTRTLEYSTQPSGYTCWMYTVDFDGVILSQFDALSTEGLARIKKGMNKDEVQRLLGQHRSIQSFPNSGEEVWDWNIRNEYPDLVATRFNVHFVDDVVVRTERSYEYPQYNTFFGFGIGGGYWGGPGWHGHPYPYRGGYWW